MSALDAWRILRADRAAGNAQQAPIGPPLRLLLLGGALAAVIIVIVGTLALWGWQPVAAIVIWALIFSAIGAAMDDSAPDPYDVDD